MVLTASIQIIEVPSDFSLYEGEQLSETGDTNRTVEFTELKNTVFEALNNVRYPVILRGIDIGPCSRKWTKQYLDKVNVEKQVKIHRSSTPKLNFLQKNFKYDTIKFSELIQHCSSPVLEDNNTSKEYLYLRSLGSDPRGKDVSDISIQFPELFADLRIPKLYPEDKFFSSVFRITSPRLQLWTHYDTCDNILIQVIGRKRIVLFPPWDCLNLYLEGDKSKVLDIDHPNLELYPEFQKTTRFEGILEEGDIVFIPSLWFHNILALDFSISVNVFWKNLDLTLYDKKDTYGNRDLIPAQLGFKTLEKAADQLKNLPSDYEDFYLRRMVLFLENRIKSNNASTKKLDL